MSFPADDTIIAVLESDDHWGDIADVSSGGAYGRAHALAVIRTAMADYETEFGG